MPQQVADEISRFAMDDDVPLTNGSGYSMPAAPPSSLPHDAGESSGGGGQDLFEEEDLDLELDYSDEAKRQGLGRIRLATARAGADGKVRRPTSQRRISRAISRAERDRGERAYREFGPGSVLRATLVAVAVMGALFAGVLASVDFDPSRLHRSMFVRLLNLAPWSLGEGAVEDVRAEATSVIAYQVGSGMCLTVVSGLGHNRGAAPVRDLVAVARILDGDEIVGKASAPLGVLVDAENLMNVQTATDLLEVLDDASSRGPSEIVLLPGKTLGYTVVFAPGLHVDSDQRVHVQFESPSVAAR